MVQAEIQTEDDLLSVTLSGPFDGAIPPEVRFRRLAETCHEHRLGRLLIDVTELRGHLGMMARLQLAMEFAQAFRDSGIRIAVVGNGDVWQARPFFEKVARHGSGSIRVFQEREAARSWLTDGAGRSQPGV